MHPIDFGTLFEKAPGANLVLSPDLNIVAVSDDYLTATMTHRTSIVDRPLFEVFPDNPDDPTADGVDNLRASLRRVVADGRPDPMAIQRYDIRAPEREGGGFTERYWSPINSPITDRAGHLCYIVHHVEDVTRLEQAKRRLGGLTETAARKDRLATFVGLVRSMATEALDPLAVIESSAYLLSRHRDDSAKARKHVERIVEQSLAVSRVLGMIANIPRERSLPVDDVSLSAELAAVLEDLERAAGGPSPAPSGSNVC